MDIVVDLDSEGLEVFSQSLVLIFRYIFLSDEAQHSVRF